VRIGRRLDDETAAEGLSAAVSWVSPVGRPVSRW
jgi:hypothetical protein